MNDLAQNVLDWYDKNKRSLPWRDDVSPYRTLVSEFMLQQTRVETVKPYFTAFMKRFPTILSLAESPVEDVLQYWKGLGYYSRAHNLHKSAKLLSQKNGFPETITELRALPGVGEYLAGAIASIALGKDEAAVDGNHHRIFSRLFCNGGKRKEMWSHARTLLPAGRAGDFNQALMDIGSGICRSKNPKCTECPIVKHCLAFDTKTIGSYPPPKKKKVIPTHRVLSVFVRNKEGAYLVVQRPDTGLYRGLFEFPSFFISTKEELQKSFLDEFSVSLTVGGSLGSISHRLTHMLLDNELFSCTVAQVPLQTNRYVSIRWIQHIEDAPLSTLAQKLFVLPSQNIQIPLF
jgi:A/G-specific adenine glycosylase